MIEPEPSDLEGRIALQMNGIVGEACREALKWQRRREHGIDYVPPLFISAELPVVPRIAPSRLGGPRIHGGPR